jgi:hypothetical protein
MLSYTPAKLASLMAIADLLETAAQEIVRESHKRSEARRPRLKRGATLRPSADTPLWNALSAAVKPHLRRRGDRALLAREMEVHRARVGEFFGRQSAMPDAERTLRLLLWLGHQAGADKAAAAKP